MTQSDSEVQKQLSDMVLEDIASPQAEVLEPDQLREEQKSGFRPFRAEYKPHEGEKGVAFESHSLKEVVAVINTLTQGMMHMGLANEDEQQYAIFRKDSPESEWVALDSADLDAVWQNYPLDMVMTDD